MHMSIKYLGTNFRYIEVGNFWVKIVLIDLIFEYENLIQVCLLIISYT